MSEHAKERSLARFRNVRQDGKSSAASWTASGARSTMCSRFMRPRESAGSCVRMDGALRSTSAAVIRALTAARMAVQVEKNGPTRVLELELGRGRLGPPMAGMAAGRSTMQMISSSTPGGS